MIRSDKKEGVYKSFRIDPGLSELAKITAAVEGKTLSSLIRLLLQEYIAAKTPFIKSRVKELLNVLSEFEKAPDDQFVKKAELARLIYPLEKADLNYYILIEKAKAAAEKLKQLGFEEEFAEQASLKFFSEDEEGADFRKALQNLAAGATEPWTKEEARRAVEKRLKEGEGE